MTRQLVVFQMVSQKHLDYIITLLCVLQSRTPSVGSESKMKSNLKETKKGQNIFYILKIHLHKTDEKEKCHHS